MPKKLKPPYDPQLVYKALAKATFDMMEGVGCAQTLLTRKVWETGGAEASYDWRAYSTAAVICYSRPFKISYGLPSLGALITKGINPSQRSCHEKILDKRDQLIAHGDESLFQIQAHSPGGGLSLHSQDKYLNEAEAKGLVQLGLVLVTRVETLRNDAGSIELLNFIDTGDIHETEI